MIALCGVVNGLDVHNYTYRTINPVAIYDR